MGELTGKVALVTGAGRGQGRAHAIALAEAGADVAICDVVEQVSTIPYRTGEPGDLEETTRLVEQLDRRCVARVVDMRDREGLAAFTKEVVGELGAIDILVANHGVFAAEPVHEIDPEQWDIVVDVCLTGVFNAIRAVVPFMIEQGGGRIIATSSGAAHNGAANMSHYAAAKAGVIGLIKTAAIDLEPYNITANAILPLGVDTPMMRNEMIRRLFCPELENPTDDDVDRKIVAIGMPVLVEPAAIAKGALSILLLSPEEAKDFSGQTMDVGGEVLNPDTVFAGRFDVTDAGA